MAAQREAIQMLMMELELIRHQHCILCLSLVGSANSSGKQQGFPLQSLLLVGPIAATAPLLFCLQPE